MMRVGVDDVTGVNRSIMGERRTLWGHGNATSRHRSVTGA